jgi:hypothetical protein
MLRPKVAGPATQPARRGAGTPVASPSHLSVLVINGADPERCHEPADGSIKRSAMCARGHWPRRRTSALEASRAPPRAPPRTERCSVADYVKSLARAQGRVDAESDPAPGEGEVRGPNTSASRKDVKRRRRASSQGAVDQRSPALHGAAVELIAFCCSWPSSHRTNKGPRSNASSISTGQTSASVHGNRDDGTRCAMQCARPGS